MPDNKPGLFDRAQRAEQRGNKDIRDLWQRYAGHRQQMTAAILALAPPGGGRVLLLGAGNANDLDLELLAARFKEVHLVDIDPAALARATGRQTPAVRARLRSHAPVDVSGLYQQLARWDVASSPLTAVGTLVDSGTAAVLAQLPSGFDVVASCCVLSQMSWALEQLLTPDAGTLALMQQALLRIHLRAMLGLMRPAGAALLVADQVSTAAYPLDDLQPDDDLAALAARLAAARVTYPVCNPELVRQMLRRDPELAALGQPELGAPWLWDGPKQQTYLVLPMVLRRRQS
jgi:SAM-dependent methyltransferase